MMLDKIEPSDAEYAIMDSGTEVIVTPKLNQSCKMECVDLRILPLEVCFPLFNSSGDDLYLPIDLKRDETIVQIQRIPFQASKSLSIPSPIAYSGVKYDLSIPKGHVALSRELRCRILCEPFERSRLLFKTSTDFPKIQSLLIHVLSKDFNLEEINDLFRHYIESRLDAGLVLYHEMYIPLESQDADRIFWIQIHFSPFIDSRPFFFLTREVWNQVKNIQIIRSDTLNDVEALTKCWSSHWNKPILGGIEQVLIPLQDSLRMNLGYPLLQTELSCQSNYISYFDLIIKSLGKYHFIW